LYRGSPVIAQCALGGAVVGDRSRNHFVFPGFTGELEILLGHLPCGLDRLGAAAGEEHPIQVARGIARQAFGELDRGRGGISPEREERQSAGLPGRDLRQLGTAMTDLHGEQPGQRVEVALAAVVEDGDALAARDDRRREVRAVASEVQPEVFCHCARERNARLGL